MDYMDPVETARRILNNEPLEETVDVETLDIDSDDELELAEDEYIVDDEDVVEEGSETKTLDTKSEEDPNLYKDATGKGAKIDTDQGTEGKDKKNKGTVTAKSSAASSKQDTPTPSGSSKERMEQHVAAMFSGEELSDEFKVKASTIFEAAINERTTAVEEELREDHTRILEEHTELITRELSEKLDDYLSYVVNEWVSDNELAIENGIRADIAENFLSGLRDLFDSSYVEVPENKHDLVDSLAGGVIDLEERLEKEIANNIELRKELLNGMCEEVFTDVSEDLVDTEAEKLRTLSEGIEFGDVDQYRDKLNVLKESYFGKNVVESLLEDGSSHKETEISPIMNTYISSLSRHAHVSKSNRVS